MNVDWADTLGSFLLIGQQLDTDLHDEKLEGVEKILCAAKKLTAVPAVLFATRVVRAKQVCR